MAWPALFARTKDWGTEILTDSDLEGQFDLIGDYINDMMNASTGHKHDGTTAEGPKITVANIDGSADDQGEVYYSSGTAVTALGVGTSGQFLQTQGAAANPQWATVNADQSQDGSTVQFVYSTDSTARALGSTIMPEDTSIPQNTEGNAYTQLDTSITPGSTTNLLVIDVTVNASNSGGQVHTAIALFQDSTANALKTNQNIIDTADTSTLVLRHIMVAGTVSSTTFKVRIGDAAGNAITANGVSGPTSRFGASAISSMSVMEIKAS